MAVFNLFRVRKSESVQQYSQRHHLLRVILSVFCILTFIVGTFTTVAPVRFMITGDKTSQLFEGTD
ncbi:MAG: hypothetical protein KAH21_09415, partial [Spirochaetaceae bacterium]|nr:hypothetical protein [Spirochaetaceae bacterium]